MNMRNRSIALGAGVLAALALVACGSSDSSDDEDQISAAIEKAATSGDPAACTEVQTQRFDAQTSGGSTGEAAVKQCQQDAADTAADKVDVTDIEVDGDTATANAAATGSVFDGQTLDLALVKEGDQWKLDEFKGFKDFDREALNASFKEEISSDPSASPQAVDCITQQVEATSDEEIQAVFVGNDPQAEERVFGPCGKFFKGE
jgi:hypothetical protein